MARIGPLTQEIIAGARVHGWHMTPKERRLVSILLQRKVTLTQAADAVYATHDDPPLHAEKVVDVLLHNLRHDFAAAFPTGRPYGGCIEFDARALEAALGKGGKRSKTASQQASRDKYRAKVRAALRQHDARALVA